MDQAQGSDPSELQIPPHDSRCFGGTYPGLDLALVLVTSASSCKGVGPRLRGPRSVSEKKNILFPFFYNHFYGFTLGSGSQPGPGPSQDARLSTGLENGRPAGTSGS